MMLQPYLACDQLFFAYSPNKMVLQNITLGLGQGSFTLLTGASGCGKSTLLRLFVRLEEPCSGRIFYQGKSLSSYPPTQLRKQVCLLGQTPTVSAGSVRDNLLIPFTFASQRGCPMPDEETLLGWLERLQLTGVALDDAAHTLSIGQRQRICLIRCLLVQPKIVLLDEPASALDQQSRCAVASLMEDLNQKEGVTVVQVDHSGYRPAVDHTQYRVSEAGLELVHA